MTELSRHEIKRHPSIKYTFVRFLIRAKIYEPLQEIYHMNRDIKVLINNSDRHHVRLTKLEEGGETGGWLLREPSKLASPPVKLVI